MKNIAVAYLDLLGQSMVERKKRETGFAPKNQQVENYENDLTAAIRLLESGYDVDAVRSVICEKSPMTKLLPDIRAMALYTGKVMESINEAWSERASRTYLEAAESYRRRAAAESAAAGLQRDYRIGMAMILKDGFPIAVVNQVIRQSAIERKADESYHKTLFSALSDGRNRYAAIMAYAGGVMSSEADVYRKFAREYMERTNTTVLTIDDEQKIIEAIYRDYMRRLQDERTAYQKDPARMMFLLKEQVQPILRKSIAQASPLYIEPGRSRETYLDETFLCACESLGLHQRDDDAYTNIKGQSRSPDGRTAARMLRSRVRTDIVKRYLIALAIAAALPDSTEYAALILAQAQEALSREDAIAMFDVNDLGSCAAAYMDAMHRQYIEKGFVNPDMDIAAMKELVLGGQYTPDQIREAMMNHSPNQIFGGADYFAYIQKLADQELVRENEKLSRYVVIPRTEMREDFEAEYQYQRRKMEGRIRLPYNITMDTKIVKALLNDGVESRNLSPMLSRYKPQNWDRDHPNTPYGSYVVQKAEKEEREKRAAQEQSIVRQRTTNKTSDTSA
ncbi:hypothetical protein [uncultured Selenomonas sp.]|uniref:hypothetical protein n=1 Tax=uncultured Selenomonas sp. TaxID=159275 RepID=UPI0028E5E14A|nr:hypothetical protein [uncultured Selenomonas sp.]